ncbi:unnamed protein product [Alternaria alternata]
MATTNLKALMPVEVEDEHIFKHETISSPTSELDLLTSPEQHWHEREDISTQLLHVLHNTPQADIEPNGLHLVYKVRDVAVGLLACPYEPPDPSAKRAQEYVKAFTDIMARLDASETINTANLQSWIDTGRQSV